MLLLPVFAAAARIQAHEALLDAATNGDTAFINKFKGNVNSKRDGNGNTALILASWYGKTDAVKALISLKADVNAKNRDGWTALIGSANGDIAALLIAAGADVNATNQNGNNALSWAVDGKMTRMGVRR